LIDNGQLFYSIISLQTINVVGTTLSHARKLTHKTHAWKSHTELAAKWQNFQRTVALTLARIQLPALPHLWKC